MIRSKTIQILTTLMGALVLLVAGAALVSADSPARLSADMTGPPGHLTREAPMLEGTVPRVSVKPLITVGEMLPNGYRFESIPDGVALMPGGTSSFDIFVNHETSRVPFRNQADFENAQLSRMTLRRGSGRVLDGSLAITSDENYIRFCSNFLATEVEGFDRPLLFTNEESSDFINLTGPIWPPGPNPFQAGRAVAHDPMTGETRTILGMGRHNHENSVAIPGYEQVVVMSGDDTFSPPSSQLYSYIADDADAVWDDEGHLYAFVGEPGFNDYGDLPPGMSISGHFIMVPDDVADGDQTVLEDWSNANNVFQFIRVEDMAYDRSKHNVVYIADTGEPRAIPDPTTGRLMRGPSGTMGPYPNGRIFRMELDPNDPLVVTSLSVLIDGDALGAASAGVLSLIHNPDNLETTERSLMIQEDPGSQNRYAPGDPNGTTARIWRYDLITGELYVVAKVDQSADPAELLGDWESSGIVDASEYFGPGTFLVTVQAHSLFIETQDVGGVLFKREGGQLLLLRIPGS